jgi:hypothetical protein
MRSTLRSSELYSCFEFGEVPGSKIGAETKYTDWGFLYSKVTPGKHRNTTGNKTKITSFHIPSIHYSQINLFFNIIVS